MGIHFTTGVLTLDKWVLTLGQIATKDAGVHKVPYGITICSICGKKALATDAT